MGSLVGIDNRCIYTRLHKSVALREGKVLSILRWRRTKELDPQKRVKGDRIPSPAVNRVVQSPLCGDTFNFLSCTRDRRGFVLRI